MPNTEVKLLSADGSEGFPFVRVGRRHAFAFFFIKKSVINKERPRKYTFPRSFFNF